MFLRSAREKYIFTSRSKLAIAALVVGFLAALLAVSLRKMTEHYEEILFYKATLHPLYLLIFPFFGLSLIYILRQYLFKKKENKGIKEVFESNASGKPLPSYKIPSHFVNGLLTVSFGGSTGIEVSTVVATAAIGSLANEKEKIFRKYKTELICAGITGGLTGLFCTPFAGLLFTYEVVSKKMSKAFIITNILAAAIAFAFITVIGEKPVFAMNISHWHVYAAPYFVLLGVLCGLHSVYLTKCVIFFKERFAGAGRHFYKIIIGAAAISLIIFLFPQLYGEGYHAITENIRNSGELALTFPKIMLFAGILFFKPIITSITLGAGGDGGVFAPSIFTGAFLGLLLAAVLNTFFDAGVIPVNFMVIGMAAMLSAAIHAPLTALFLVCGLVDDYTLFLPIFIVCFISKHTAQMVYPYTVYSLPAKK
jgi:CIC family chloride channel protein